MTFATHLPTRHPPQHSAIYIESTDRSVLRCGDEADANVITVDHRVHEFACEVCRANQPLLEGEWLYRLPDSVHENGHPAQWANICSEVNDEAAYVEFALELGGDWRIERQVFLARRDQFVLLADVVQGPAGAAGDYAMSLPLGNGLRWESATESNEGGLFVGRRRLATVIPLGLAEWCADGGGRLVSTNGRLQLSQAMTGRRTWAALFFDFNVRRRRQPITWRRLSVGESLRTVPRDVAAGVRVQIGKSQWLAYRSLGPRGNRTVLGQNFGSEFVVARFNRDGTVAKLLEIE